MQGYTNKNMLISEITKTANMFITEFEGITEAEKAIRFEGVDRTPQEMISYQLGWMELILSWDRDELAGKKVVTPAPRFKWNQLGGLYQSFYDRYQDKSITELRDLFNTYVEAVIKWLQCFNEEELFSSGGRNWAASTPSNWPIWKWVHINTAAPFKSFRSKIRKWKKMRSI
jgi:hypothetical protein